MNEDYMYERVPAALQIFESEETIEEDFDRLLQDYPELTVSGKYFSISPIKLDAVKYRLQAERKEDILRLMLEKPVNWDAIAEVAKPSEGHMIFYQEGGLNFDWFLLYRAKANESYHVAKVFKVDYVR
jgi:hypothetical protein